MSTIFEKYEQPTEVTGESLTIWTDILSKLIEELNAEGTSTAEFESKVRKDLVKQEVNEDLVKLCDEFAHSVFAIIDEDAASAVHLYEMLRLFTGTVKDERDYHTHRIARLTKPRAAVGEDFDEKKSDAEKVKAHVENLYNVLDMMAMIPEGFKIKTLKDGSVKPDLPRIPSGPREGGGRKSATHNLRLTVDGVLYETPINTVLHDVVSTGASRVNVTDLKDAVTASGADFGKGWDNDVVLNGHVITGTVISVTGEATEDDENSNEDDANNDDV